MPKKSTSQKKGEQKELSGIGAEGYEWGMSEPRRDKAGFFKFADTPDFTPNLSPAEVLQMGSFGGGYFRDIYSSVTKQHYTQVWKELPEEWLKGLKIPTQVASSKYRNEVNKYKVNCGVKEGVEDTFGLSAWEAKGWIVKQDPYGWFQWYCRFFQGRRSEDDERQIDRWRKVCGKTGRWKQNLIAKCLASGKAYDDESVSPVVRQTLQHWGYALNEKDFQAGSKRVRTHGAAYVPREALAGVTKFKKDIGATKANTYPVTSPNKGIHVGSGSASTRAWGGVGSVTDKPKPKNSVGSVTDKPKPKNSISLLHLQHTPSKLLTVAEAALSKISGPDRSSSFGSSISTADSNRKQRSGRKGKKKENDSERLEESVRTATELTQALSNRGHTVGAAFKREKKNRAGSLSLDRRTGAARLSTEWRHDKRTAGEEGESGARWKLQAIAAREAAKQAVGLMQTVAKEMQLKAAAGRDKATASMSSISMVPDNLLNSNLTDSSPESSALTKNPSGLSLGSGLEDNISDLMRSPSYPNSVSKETPVSDWNDSASWGTRSREGETRASPDPSRPSKSDKNAWSDTMQLYGSLQPGRGLLRQAFRNKKGRDSPAQVQAEITKMLSTCPSSGDVMSVAIDGVVWANVNFLSVFPHWSSRVKFLSIATFDRVSVDHPKE